MPSRRLVNVTQLVIDDLSAAPFGCYRHTTRRSWKNLRGRVPVTLRRAPLECKEAGISEQSYYRWRKVRLPRFDGQFCSWVYCAVDPP